MIQTRKLRIVVLAVIAVFVFYFIFTKKDLYSLAAVEKTPQKQGSTLIESANNDKEDAAINKEISKQKNGEDSLGKSLPQKPVAPDGMPAKSISTQPFDPEKEFRQTRVLAPMTIFSKSYCPFSKRLKSLLKDNYEITPQPIIVELDKHEHGKEFQEYLAEVTERGTVPNVLVGSSHASRGGCDDFVKLHEAGKLLELLNTWGNKQMSAKRIEVPLNA